MLDLKALRPAQALAASIIMKRKRLLLALPRQFGGKTELGVRLLEDVTCRPFTSSSLFLAKDKSSAKKATREKFERIFDRKLFAVNTENVYLKNYPTSIIFMGSVDKDPDRLRGGTYSMIVWSEVAFSKIEKGETIVSVFDKVIQPTLTQTDGYVLLESTNNGKNGWFDLWENYREYGFARLKLGLDDMVYMGLLTEEEYDSVQRTTHPDVFRQEYLCDWVSFAGRAYPEFNEDIHVEEFDGPQEWQQVVAAIDWGYDPSATCILFGYVRDGILHVFDEHYQMRELPAVTAEAIEQKKAQWRITNLAAVADHEPDRIEELTRRNINCSLASKANVMGARMEIKERLYFKTMLIHPRCQNTIRDLAAACWSDKKEGELDYSACTWGHFDAEGALRYLVRELGNFEADEPIKNPHTDSASAAEHDMIMEKRLNGGYK